MGVVSHLDMNVQCFASASDHAWHGGVFGSENGKQVILDLKVQEGQHPSADVANQWMYI